nr:hypothetical protein [Acidobacteriota bacterium]
AGESGGKGSRPSPRPAAGGAASRGGGKPAVPPAKGTPLPKGSPPAKAPTLDDLMQKFNRK